jgi:hypothetical protein
VFCGWLFFLTTEFTTIGFLSWHHMHIYHRIARYHFLDGVVKKNWGSPLNLGKAWWHINNRFYSFAIYCTLMFFLCISSTCQRPWLSCNNLMPQRIDLSQNVLSGNGFHMEVLGTIAPSSYPALTCGLSTDPFSPFYTQKIGIILITMPSQVQKTH